MVETPSNTYGISVNPNYIAQPNPLEDMLDAEKRDLGERISKLESWIKERQGILYSNLSRLDERECAVDSQLYWSRAMHPYENREAQGLEKSLLDLEVQRRLERGGAWKDMFLANKELLEMIREYQGLKRRDAIMK